MPEPTRGLLDTNVLIQRSRVNAADLPEEAAISAVTLGELAAGPHHVFGDDADAVQERARRVAVLQRAESEFDALPYDADAARVFGRVSAAVRASGRAPRRRVADLMIAATAAANGLALYSANPDDFAGLDGIVEVRPVRLN